jgi:hypothetical protein
MLADAIADPVGNNPAGPRSLISAAKITPDPVATDVVTPDPVIAD